MYYFTGEGRRGLNFRPVLYQQGFYIDETNGN
ncbi:MAG: hypothetical protein K0S12_42 [Bacteroidetes bacterium]|nr:hypothetical protein [Bacteroidota bacterium]